MFPLRGLWGVSWYERRLRGERDRGRHYNCGDVRDVQVVPCPTGHAWFVRADPLVCVRMAVVRPVCQHVLYDFWHAVGQHLGEAA